jgi:hypothetical protein
MLTKGWGWVASRVSEKMRRRVLMLADILAYDAATTVLGFVYSTNQEKR